MSDEPKESVKAAAGLLQMSGAELLAILHSDWAARVLDAFQRAEMQNHDNKRRGLHCYETSLCFAHDGSEAWAIEIPGWDIAAAETPEAARQLAADMLFSTLPESVRAELGECP